MVVSPESGGSAHSGFCSVVCCPHQVATHTTSLSAGHSGDAHAHPDRRCLYVLPLGLAFLCPCQASPLRPRRVRIRPAHASGEDFAAALSVS